VTIPYMAQDFMVNQTNSSTWEFAAVLEAFSQPDPSVDCPIYINTYLAAESDFQASGVLDWCMDVQSNVRMDFSQPFPPIHPSLKAMHHDALVCGEQYSSLRQTTHRWIPYYKVGLDAFSNQVYNPQPYLLDGTKKLYFGIEAVGQFYVFYRGGVRIRVLPSSSVAGTMKSMYFKDDNGNNLAGVILTSPVNLPVLEGEYSYFFKQLYRQTRPNTLQTQAKFVTSSIAGNAAYLFKSFADDGSYHFLAPPSGTGNIFVIPTGSAYGLSGLNQTMT